LGQGVATSIAEQAVIASVGAVIGAVGIKIDEGFRRLTDAVVVNIDEGLCQINKTFCGVKESVAV